MVSVEFGRFLYNIGSFINMLMELSMPILLMWGVIILLGLGANKIKKGKRKNDSGGGNYINGGEYADDDVDCDMDFDFDFD